MRLGMPLIALGLRHLRESWKIILAVGAAALAPLVAAAGAALATGLNFSFFTRDPLAVAEAPVYLGFVSNLGVMIWTAGAVLALFGGLRVHAGTAKGRFLAAAGAFSLLLAADDMFMLHDVVYITLGIDASLLYGVVALGGIWHYRQALLRETNFPLFLLAFGGLATSAGIDGMLHVVGLNSLPGSAFVEDCFKFLGICFWVTYAWGEAAQPPAATVGAPVDLSLVPSPPFPRNWTAPAPGTALTDVTPAAPARSPRGQL